MKDRLQKLADSSASFAGFIHEIKRFPRYYLAGRMGWTKADLERFYNGGNKP